MIGSTFYNFSLEAVPSGNEWGQTMNISSAEARIPDFSFEAILENVQ
jgi:hypothetical protein